MPTQLGPERSKIQKTSHFCHLQMYLFVSNLGPHEPQEYKIKLVNICTHMNNCQDAIMYRENLYCHACLEEFAESRLHAREKLLSCDFPTSKALTKVTTFFRFLKNNLWHNKSQSTEILFLLYLIEKKEFSFHKAGSFSSPLSSIMSNKFNISKASAGRTSNLFMPIRQIFLITKILNSTNY